MPMRECARPGCAVLVVKGYCDTCKATRDSRVPAEHRRAKTSERGYGAAWQKARAAYLAKHPLCRDIHRSHAGRVVLATDVDHIVPHRGDKSLFWDSSNWQPLCHECHSRKTALEDGGFGRYRHTRQ
jgi:5-methylcytosine-specific restriction protein A